MKFDYNKSLGQNFLKDNNIINKISDSINPNNNDLIIEIGPGAGALTKELVKKNCDVLIKLPMRQGAESLNVANTASIVGWEWLNSKMN